MTAQPTAVKMQLVSSEAAVMSYCGPFGCVPEALQSAASALSGWSRAMSSVVADREVDVTMEFDYGDYIYHEQHTLFSLMNGGVEATLFWLDADVCDWLHSELPRQMAARRMIGRAL